MFSSSRNERTSCAQDRDRVLLKRGVGCHQRDAFDRCLRGEETVERVAVDRRERRDRERVTGQDRKLCKAFFQRAHTEPLWRNVEIRIAA